MTEEGLKLLMRMVVNTIAGEKEHVRQLYEEYLWEKRLRVTIREYTNWRQTV